MTGTNHSLVLMGLVGGGWKIRWKVAQLGLNSGTSGPEPRTQLLHHTATHIHTHTHTYTYIHINNPLRFLTRSLKYINSYYTI